MEKYGWLCDENLTLDEKIPFNEDGDAYRYVIHVGDDRCEQIENSKADIVAMIAGKDSFQCVDEPGMLFLKAGKGTVQIVGELRERREVEVQDADCWFRFSLEGGFQRVSEDYVLECLSVEGGKFEKLKSMLLM